MRHNSDIVTHLLALNRLNVTNESAYDRVSHRGTYKYLQSICLPPNSNMLGMLLQSSRVSALHLNFSSTKQ